MDTLTHALLGAAGAKAIFGKKLGNKAAITAAICASLPDLDMLARFAGPEATITWHRAATHSFIIAAAATPLLGWALCKLLDKGKNFRLWSMLAGFSLFSHILLDCLTTFGTQIFSPFTDYRLSLDALPIIDPLITLPLLGVLIIGLIPAIKKRSRFLCQVAVIWCCLYAMMGFYMNRQALATAGQPEHTRAIPRAGTIFLWRCIGINPENGEASITDVDALRKKVLNKYRQKTDNSTQTTAVLQSRNGKVFKWFSGGYLITSRKNENTIDLIDIRYGLISMPEKPMFTARATLDNKGNIEDFKYIHYRLNRELISRELNALSEALFPQCHAKEQ